MLWLFHVGYTRHRFSLSSSHPLLPPPPSARPFLRLSLLLPCKSVHRYHVSPYIWLTHSADQLSAFPAPWMNCLSHRVPFPKSLVRRKEGGPQKKGSHVSEAQKVRNKPRRAQGRAARQILKVYQQEGDGEASEPWGCFWLQVRKI